MTFLGYIIGVCLHVLQKWVGYFAGHRDRPFMSYWPKYWPLVVKGTIFDLVIFGMYRLGWAVPLLDWTVERIGSDLPTNLPLPQDAAGSLALWLGVTIGFIADSAGKTFMPAFGRLYSSVLPKKNSRLPQ